MTTRVLVAGLVGFFAFPFSFLLLLVFGSFLHGLVIGTVRAAGGDLAISGPSQLLVGVAAFLLAFIPTGLAMRIAYRAARRP